MIRAHFGIARDPFVIDHDAPLLAHQQRHFDFLEVHARQGGFCLILGEPGTGKSVLIGQPALNTTLQLRINHDLKTRVTYSARLETLTAAHLIGYIHTQLDAAGLPHSTFTEEALNLIARSAEGTLRAAKNLCIGALIEAVRDRTRTVDLKHVNAVLLQPHWRHNPVAEPSEPVLIPPNNLPARS